MLSTLLHSEGIHPRPNDDPIEARSHDSPKLISLHCAPNFEKVKEVPPCSRNCNGTDPRSKDPPDDEIKKHMILETLDNSHPVADHETTETIEIEIETMSHTRAHDGAHIPNNGRSVKDIGGYTPYTAIVVKNGNEHIPKEHRKFDDGSEYVCLTCEKALPYSRHKVPNS